MTPKIATIHQPDFMPWLGFFQRWKESDIYIVLDDVQFIKRGWHHRDKIKTPIGAKWLTIPVKNKGRYAQLIIDTEMDNSRNWRAEHLNILQDNYAKAPSFNRLFPKLEEIYSRNHELLRDFNVDIIRLLALELEIDVPLVFSSQYNVTSSSTARLVDLCLKTGSTVYYTGTGSRAYLDETLFEKNGISVLWQKFKHPVYEQLHGEFIPGLTALDYLMCQKG